MQQNRCASHRQGSGMMPNCRATKKRGPEGQDHKAVQKEGVYYMHRDIEDVVAGVLQTVQAVI